MTHTNCSCHTDFGVCDHCSACSEPFDESYINNPSEADDNIEPAVCDYCGAYFAYDGGRDVCFSCRRL